MRNSGKSVVRVPEMTGRLNCSFWRWRNEQQRSSAETLHCVHTPPCECPLVWSSNPLLISHILSLQPARLVLCFPTNLRDFSVCEQLCNVRVWLRGSGTSCQGGILALLSISLLPWPTSQVWKQPCPGFTQSLSSKKSQNGFASKSDYTHYSGQGKHLFGKGSQLPKTVLTTPGKSYRMTGQLSHWRPGLPAGPP